MHENPRNQDEAIQRNIYDLERQLNAARVRIKCLHDGNDEKDKILKRINKALSKNELSMDDIEKIILSYAHHKAQK